MTTKYSMNISVDGVNKKHEDRIVTEKDVGNEHITTVIRDIDEDGVHTHEEQITTDMEADNFHKVVTTTTTVTAEGQKKTVTKVTTDKDLDGEHIHTEMVMDENGVKDVTVIEDGKESVKVVDKVAGGAKIHKEVVDKDVGGVHAHEELKVTEKDVGNEHLTTLVRDAVVGDKHIHTEARVTDMEADNFHKEVVNTTITTPSGEKHETRVSTDKDLNGEHIHTEMVMDENGVKDVTVIEDSKETVKVVDKIAGGAKIHKEVVDKDVGGVHAHEELKVTEKDVGNEHLTTLVRDADVGDKHVHSEATVTDVEAEHFHKEVVNTTTTTPSGEKHETRVTTDREVDGEHIHKESHFKTGGPDNLVVKDVTVVSNPDNKEVTAVVEKVDGDTKVHSETVVKDVGGIVVKERLNVVETSTADSTTTRTTRDADADGARVHIESKVTDMATDNYHKEVINTSTSGTLGETHVTRVVTDKDVDGDHIHTELVMDGETATDLCIVDSAAGSSKVMDQVSAGVKVHTEEVVRIVNGQEVREKVTVTKKGTDGKHVTNIVRDADSENRHVHSDATVTDMESESFHKEVINTTITTPEGETRETRVTTDRDIGDEHIHTETIIDEDGVREATIIEKPGEEVNAIIDQEGGGIKVHKELVEKIVDGQKVTETVKVTERGAGNNHVTTIVRDVECGDNQFHAEAVVTDLEDEHFHKEVLKTTTTTPSSETHVTRITTDKDVDGEHIHTEQIIDGDGVREATLIERPDNEYAAIVDETNNGVNVHKEVVEKIVDGKPIKDEIEVVEKNVGEEHQTTITRDAQRGQCSVHAETTVTDVDENNFQRKVTQTTKTTPAGEVKETRVTTDKDVEGEHIHTEMITKKDALGNIVCEDATVIKTDEGVATVVDTTTADKKEHREIVDSTFDGIHTHEQVKVTQRDVGSEHITEVVKDVDQGSGVVIHEETTVIDDGDFHREVTNKQKTTPSGNVRMCHVTTDNVVDGEHIHTETIDENGPDGHIVKDITIVDPMP